MPDDPNAKLMQCMEVWGGNERVDRSVIMPGIDAWIYSRPYEEATGGGDVHYVSTCAAGQITRMLVADVSGHGEAVASVATDLRKLMRRHVNDHDQRRFVGALNRDFTATAKAGIFATAVALTFDAPASRLTLCNAGHPPPLHYASREGAWRVLDARAGDENVPWGITEAAYEQTELEVAAGDLVLLYTDALMEANDRRGEMLGPAGLRRIASEVDLADAGRFIPSLLSAVDAESPGNLAKDDVTCMLLRPNGGRRSVPFMDRRLAAWRMLASFAGLRFGWSR